MLETDPTHLATRLRLKELFLDGGEIEAEVEQLYAIVDLLEERDPANAQQYAAQIGELTGSMPSFSSRPPADGAAPAQAPEPRPSALPRGTAGAATPGTDDLAPMSPEEFEAVPVREPAARGDAAKAEFHEIDEVLEEVEFFLGRGLTNEARDTVEEALTEHPDHPLLLEKLAELSGRPLEAPPSERPAPPPSVSTQPDASRESTGPLLLFEEPSIADGLAEEIDPDLAAGEGSGVLDVETVFAQFKKGVEETVALEDSETHNDLGIAYKEMGLLDDAIHEFELCLTNPERECSAHTMIGLCYVEKGDVPEAIGHFKKGLYSDHKNEQEELGLYFELGAAYELLRDPKEAVYYYQKVHKRRPDFRNVAERIAALGFPASLPPKDPTKEKDEELGEAFDDLVRSDDS